MYYSYFHYTLQILFAKTIHSNHQVHAVARCPLFVAREDATALATDATKLCMKHGAVAMHNGTIQVEKSGLFLFGLSLTAKEVFTSGKISLDYSVTRNTEVGIEHTLLARHFDYDESGSDNIAFHRFDEFEVFSLLKGDRIGISVSEPRMIYRSIQTNYLTLLGYTRT